jgi:hypothetical protein
MILGPSLKVRALRIRICIDDAVVIDKLVYIEHGHPYDKFTTVILDRAADRTETTGQLALWILFLTGM